MAALPLLDPAWWQAFAAIAQVVLAGALFWITRRYVKLTADLVKLQQEMGNMQQQAERRELYDRRIVIYHDVMKFLAEFARHLKIDFQQIMQLYRDTREAELLFFPEIQEFIDEVAKTANEIWTLQANDAIASGDQTRLNRIHELRNWLVAPAFEQAKTLFGRYLKLTDPGSEKAPSHGPVTSK